MSRVIVSDVLTTTATGTFTVVSYTVPSGCKFKLKVIVAGGEPTTWSTTESDLGFCYPVINGVELRGLEARAMQGDATGVYGKPPTALSFGGAGAGFSFAVLMLDIELKSGDVISIVASPVTTTSTRWRGTIIGQIVALGKLAYFTEPPTTGWNKLKYAVEPPQSGWNKLLYEGE